MIKVIDIGKDKPTELCTINVTLAAAPRDGDWIVHNEETYLVTSRRYVVSELGNLERLEIRVTKC
jgi:hypothetical protein